ncbi:unnamed protein product [Lymnaea stagnalis]|uniref:Uncharacterized protein n=1 Tax=Lymnaea stagnalis TaxID=6523 RepID=A0AAV2I3W3_LYMST
MPMQTLLVPQSLKIKGRGLSPQPPLLVTSAEDITMSSISTSRSSMSDDDSTSHKSEDYTVLDGVREMNQILVRQIETLRLKIKVDENNYQSSRAHLEENKERELQRKDSEIEDLRESVTSRDEQINKLMKASQEKDRAILSKSAEIDDLKKMVRQTKEYAQKIKRQVGQIRNHKEKLEADPLYKEQNETIVKLNEELDLLKDKLETMEQELARAMKVIEQQEEKLRNIDSDKVAMQKQFREDLDKATKSMKQEVARMGAVMHQNHEEMKNLSQQNKSMHDDVRFIIDALKSSRLPPENTEVTSGGIERARTVAAYGPILTQGAPTISSSQLIGTNPRKTRVSNPGPLNPQAYGTNFQQGNSLLNRNSPNRQSGRSDVNGQLSPDYSARTTMGKPKTIVTSTPHNLNVPTLNNPKPSSLPPICSVQDGILQPAPTTTQRSARGGRSGVKRGSNVKK